MNLVVTGGGTGGHIFAGIAIAQEFLKQSKKNDVLFIGSDYGLENRLVPKAGLKLETLTLGKLVGQSFFKKALTLFQIPFAVFKCILLLKKYKADMVVGVGGYAAGPCLVAARILGIRSGVLEQNAILGFTNRLSVKLAKYVFLAFPEIPEGVSPQKCIVTGNPVRSELKPSAAKPAKPFIIFAFGGSQGASGINRMLTEAARELLPFKDEIQIYHQTGEKEFELIQKKYEEIGFPAHVYKFIDDMQSMYNRASLVVCRAGSSTLSELGATRNASILIPFPHAAGNHQEFNARVVEHALAAKVLLQEKLSSDGQKTMTSGSELAALILELCNNPQSLEQMRQNSAQFYRPQAAEQIVNTMKTELLLASSK